MIRCSPYEHIQIRLQHINSHRFRMSKLAVLILFLTAYTTALAAKSLVGKGLHHVGSFRILGGDVAPDGAYPFMVSLRRYPNKHFCGGSIVNNLWVLTSAHCIAGESIGSVFAVVGTNLLSFGGYAAEVRKIIMHPNFNDTGDELDDIALLQLDSPLSYSATIAPVTLDTSTSQSIINVTLIGWGTTRNKGSMSNFLRELSTQTISQATCSLYWSAGLNADHICTKFRNGKGFCSGDSGGPLINTNSKKQVGVAAFNFDDGCGMMLPDVFSRISSYMSWIQSTTNPQG
ncbi:hypothetical protein Trydic_g12368 [Trypoxylus dichotomus]